MKLIKKNIVLFLLLIGIFFLTFDQYLKLIARTNKDFTYYIIKPWFGWEYLGNTGIAFGIPIPNILLIIITPLIIFSLAILLIKKHKKKSSLFLFGLILIITGAISNLIDRFLFEVTIDYLRIFTSIINFADIMIVIGATILIIKEFQNKKS